MVKVSFWLGVIDFLLFRTCRPEGHLFDHLEDDIEDDQKKVCFEKNVQYTKTRVRTALSRFVLYSHRNDHFLVIFGHFWSF
jgi:hypothetical protein